jgi:hypothetical protein
MSDEPQPPSQKPPEQPAQQKPPETPKETGLRRATLKQAVEESISEAALEDRKWIKPLWRWFKSAEKRNQAIVLVLLLLAFCM